MFSVTQCPTCSTKFKVLPQQLRASEGWVRCGRCNNVFDATDHFIEYVPRKKDKDKAAQTAAATPPAPATDEKTQQAQAQAEQALQALAATLEGDPKPAGKEQTQAQAGEQRADPARTDKARTSSDSADAKPDAKADAKPEEKPATPPADADALNERPSRRWLRELSETFRPQSSRSGKSESAKTENAKAESPKAESPKTQDRKAGSDASAPPSPAPASPSSAAPAPLPLTSPSADEGAAPPAAHPSLAVGDSDDEAQSTANVAVIHATLAEAAAAASTFQQEVERWQARQQAGEGAEKKDGEKKDTDSAAAESAPADQQPVIDEDIPPGAIVLAPAVLPKEGQSYEPLLPAETPEPIETKPEAQKPGAEKTEHKAPPQAEKAAAQVETGKSPAPAKTKPEAKPAETKAKDDVKTDVKAKAEIKAAEAKPAPAQPAGAKAAEKTGEKPGEKPAEKPAAKPAEKAEKASEKTAEKPAEKSADKPAEKPASKAPAPAPAPAAPAAPAATPVKPRPIAEPLHLEFALTDLDEPLPDDADDATRAQYRAAFSQTQELNFVRKAARDAFWRSPRVRLGMLIGSVLLVLSLALQYLVHNRNHLAAGSDAMHARMQGFCRLLGCTISPLRQLEVLEIEGSTFQNDGDGVFTLSWSVRNRGKLRVLTPELALSLRDDADQTLLRRTIRPGELPSAPETIGPGQQWQAQQTLKITAHEQAVTGYQLQIFYGDAP